MLAKLSEAMETRANIWALENDEPPEFCPYSELADAVLGALMTPDEGILRAGQAAAEDCVADDYDSDENPICTGVSSWASGSVWKAMLTAARSGG